jgi:N-acetylneuraminate synthase
MQQIHKAVKAVGEQNLAIMHCTSTYPCEPEELNPSMVQTLRREFPHNPDRLPGHGGPGAFSRGVALGACMVERHLTLDRHVGQ